MKRRTLLAGCGAGLASALAGCAGAIRSLEFAYVEQRDPESDPTSGSDSDPDPGVVIEVGVMATTNVQGEKSDFYEVTAAGYTCEGRRVCQVDVGHVPDDSSQEDPVTATLRCPTVPDGIALGARTGPCKGGVATFPWAVHGEETGWTVNNFDRECSDRFPPERLCRSIGKTRGPGKVATDGDDDPGNGTDTGDGA